MYKVQLDYMTGALARSLYQLLFSFRIFTLYIDVDRHFVRYVALLNLTFHSHM